MTGRPEEVTVTVRVENSPGPIPGSEKNNCEECGADVWVSPATQEEIQHGVYPDYIVCLKCTGDDSE